MQLIARENVYIVIIKTVEKSTDFDLTPMRLSYFMLPALRIQPVASNSMSYVVGHG